MPFCNTGWGPGNGHTLDFTSCFSESVLQNIPAVFLLVAGTARLVYLRGKQRSGQDKQQDVEEPRKFRIAYHARLAVAGLLLVLSAATLVVAAVAEAGQHASVLVASSLSLLSVLFALVLTRAEHAVMRTGSTVLSLFWLFKWLTGAISLRTYALLGVGASDPAYFALSALTVAGCFLASVLELVQPAPCDGELPEPRVSIFSRLTFWWMNPLMLRGSKMTLVMDDLYRVHPKMVSRIANQVFVSRVAAHGELSTAMFWGLVREYWLLLAAAVLSQAIALTMTLTQPLLVGLLMGFVQSYQKGHGPSQPVEYGYFYAVMVLVVSLLRSIFNEQATHKSMQLSIRMRVTYMNFIYRKALRLAVSGKRSANIGQIVNHMSVDAAQVALTMTMINNFWTTPVTIAIAVYFLYGRLGVASFAGLAVVLLVGPALGRISGFVVRFRKEMMRHSDARVRLVGEVVSAMKLIKLYASESYFVRRLMQHRQREQSALKKIWYLNAGIIAGTGSISSLMTLVSFAVYVAIAPADAPLNYDRVFVSLGYFAIIRQPLDYVQYMTDKITTALVAYKRIVAYMDLEEVDITAVDRDYQDSLSGTAISICGGSFAWTRGGDKADEPAPASETDQGEIRPFALANIDLAVARGTRTAVVGRVGDGKSSLLHAILGEMIKTGGEVHVRGTVAYVAQQAWLFNGSLRDNIVFGSKYNEKRYQRVLHACSLLPDLRILPDGDQTAIGDKGVNLSGGQKARVSLARAVYADADIYLLDDCLSAVDAHVDQHIFAHVLGSQGLLADKTVFMATHGIHHLRQFDSVVQLKEGRIVEQGTVPALMQQQGGVYELIQTFARHTGSSDSATDAASSLDVDLSECGSGGGTEDALITPPDAPLAGVALAKSDDDSLTGSVDWSVYRFYVGLAKQRHVVLFVVMLVVMIALGTFSGYWMLVMSEAATGHGASASMLYYLGVYGALVGAYLIQSVLLFVTVTVVIGVSVGWAMHEKLLRAVVRAPMSWFDTTPAGRIITRFSSDIITTDLGLLVAFLNMSGYTMSMLEAVVLVAISAPWAMALVPFLVAMMYFIQRFYLASNREIQRMDSGSTAPIYQLFEETLHGVVTIRAYRCEARLTEMLEARVDRKTRASYMVDVCSRWLVVSLNCLSSLLLFSVALVCVATRNSTFGGMVGLGLINASSLVASFLGATLFVCQLEGNMVSVERLRQYTMLESEAAEHAAAVESHWPAAGQITFCNYTTTYKGAEKPVLCNLSLSVRGGEKVGICGRTGAGKSSLTLALFRLMEASEGRIEIDGQDISKVGLADLRGRLTIIPQDPVLFDGTMRSNLDPLEQHDDAELWSVLELVGIKDYIAGLQGRLTAEVSQGGSNFSAGQKQLLTLARALLGKQRIVIFDEATSATDAETDAFVQRTIRTEFKDCTVLTIAHRIDTIMDSDRILVLDQGHVAEFDSPQVLLQNQDSAFTRLVVSSRGPGQQK
ncbi:hypothetical protein RI367_006059 [Sorochytrium milnesiophthora]